MYVRSRTRYDSIVIFPLWSVRILNQVDHPIVSLLLVHSG